MAGRSSRQRKRRFYPPRQVALHDVPPAQTFAEAFERKRRNLYKHRRQRTGKPETHLRRDFWKRQFCSEYQLAENVFYAK